MYKVILVDDDYPVLEFLNTIIPWSDLGFEVAFLAQDGVEALQYISVNSPDVIITDIGMPIMDGIELIKHAKDINRTIYSIFLTCHDDFHHAQQAIKLNSYDYILKETINLDNIKDLLKGLKIELDKEIDKMVELNKMKYLIKDNLTVLRTRFIKKLLEDERPDITNWFNRHKQELGLASNFETCIPVICYIDDYTEHLSTFVSNDLLEVTLNNAFTEVLSKTRNSFSVFYKNSIFFILYSFDQGDESAFFAKVVKSLTELQSSLNRYLNVSITAIIGEQCEFSQGLREQLNVLIESGLQRFYLEHQSITKLDTAFFSTQNIFIHYMDAYQEFQTSLINQDQTLLPKSVNQWMQFIKEERYHPEAAKEWVLNIFLDIKQTTNFLKNTDSKHSLPMINQQILAAETISELESLFMKALINIRENLAYSNGVPKRNEIIEAERYVLDNMAKKITLSEVAEHVYLNPSYFSRLYKESTGENFIDYVNRIKMERAKRIIDSSNEPIEKVAYMLGFDSKSYFLRVFKKHFGVAPRNCKIDPFSIEEKHTQNQEKVI